MNQLTESFDELDVKLDSNNSNNSNNLNNLIKSFNNLDLNSISATAEYDLHDLHNLINIFKKLKIDDQNKYICIYHNSDKSICRIYDCFGHNHIMQILNYNYVS